MKAIAVVAALLRDGDKVLIVRRGPGETGAGFWEFPGGKVDPGETHEQALAREILEELNLVIKVEGLVADAIYDYPQKKIHLFLYECVRISGQIRLVEHDAQEWIQPAKLDPEILSFADRGFVQVLRAQSRK